MHEVYILKSLSTGRYYTGESTSADKRLERHNDGLVKSTRNRGPWKIVFRTSVESRAEALELERKIKKRGAGRYLKDFGM